MNADDTELVAAHTSSGAEELAKKAPAAHVVSAFGTVPSEVFFGVFHQGAGRQRLQRRRERLHPQRMLGGNFEGLAKTQSENIRQGGGLDTAFAFVGGKDHGFAGAV